MNKEYKSHYNIRSQILAEANKYPGVKLWANPVGRAFMGEKVRDYKIGIDNFIVLKNPRRVTFGLPKGSADTIGFKTERIGGIIVPRFCAFEIKTGTDKTRPGQDNFINMVQRFGGIAGVTRDSSDLHRLLESPLVSANNL